MTNATINTPYILYISVVWENMDRMVKRLQKEL